MTPDKDKRKEKLTTARKNKIKTFLKARGHKAATVNAATIADTDELIDLLCSLHGIDRQAQYEPATA